jgi:hypothetical protein
MLRGCEGVSTSKGKSGECRSIGQSDKKGLITPAFGVLIVMKMASVPFAAACRGEREGEGRGIGRTPSPGTFSVGIGYGMGLLGPVKRGRGAVIVLGEVTPYVGLGDRGGVKGGDGVLGWEYSKGYDTRGGVSCRIL